MNRITRFAAAFIVAVMAPLSVLAQAQPEGADRAAIRAIIEDQIAAFQRDDGEAAYAMASRDIQDIFPSVETFMEMVRGRYLPVYRPRSVVFGTREESPLGPLQRVFLTGPDGDSYVAIYSLERQADGSWKISGCALVRDDAPRV